MLARILSDENNELTIELKLPLKGSMLECEDAILDGLNEVGTLATEKALSKFDADGSPIHVGKIKLTARSRDEANYQTPYPKFGHFTLKIKNFITIFNSTH